MSLSRCGWDLMSFMQPFHILIAMKETDARSVLNLSIHNTRSQLIGVVAGN